MELNHVLLFTAIASTFLIFLQSLRLGNHPQRLSAFFVVIASLFAWFVARPIAGWIAATAWCTLLLVPAWRRHRMQAAREQSYRARRVGIALSPAVITFLILNVMAFAAEIVLGGPTDARTLGRLGWLDTDSVIYDQQY